MITNEFLSEFKTLVPVYKIVKHLIICNTSKA